MCAKPERPTGSFFEPTSYHTWTETLAVPVSRMERYCTVADNQRQVELDIRQGESPIGSDNLHLGKLDIEVPPLPAGEAAIEVRFTYDANGLLEVDARDVQGGRTATTLIRNTATEMSETQIAEALKQLRTLKRLGWTGLSMRDLEPYLRGEKRG